MPKSTLALKRVAPLNCRTLAATRVGEVLIEDNLMSLAQSMERLNLDVIMVTETKRRKSNFDFSYGNNRTISCFFGSFKKVGGVGFLVNSALTKLICFSSFISIRLGRIDFMLDGVRIAMIVGYAPILKDKGTDEFYNDLIKLLLLKPFDDVLIGGDFNARLANKYTRDISSTNFSPIQNTNGDALLEFATANNLSILLFPRRSVVGGPGTRLAGLLMKMRLTIWLSLIIFLLQKEPGL
uniref:Endo/exonuclease/phosphatase domain-containing protein n=1 Tax=Rhabditophanes sp. KR3021 TaxID=114890 RepID=A0AC35TVX3_9BILA